MAVDQSPKAPSRPVTMAMAEFVVFGVFACAFDVGVPVVISRAGRG